VISTSAYDGLGRRIAKVVSNCGDLDMTYHFYYEGQSIVELRNGSDMVLKQHFWAALAGGYIDELLENAVNEDPTDGSEQDCELRGWACHDANYNVVGFIDDGAAVLERYEYTPYGQRVVFYSAGSNDPLAHTPTLIPRRVELGGTLQPYGAYAIGHQGLYHDEETGETLIYNRARMLHTRLGRFTQRDPLGYVDGMNIYTSVRINPYTYLDPEGTDVITISSRGVQSTGGTMGHYSVEYWETTCSIEVGTYASNVTMKKLGATRKDGWELRMDPDWKLQKQTGGFEDVWISVIHNSGKGTQHIIVYDSNPNEAQTQWDTVANNAKQYAYAEQVGFNGRFAHWPNSQYQLPPGNNSNTFGRWLVTTSGMPMYEHPAPPHPGGATPQQLTQPAGTVGHPIPK
jgi:RHS repeat-associated protein